MKKHSVLMVQILTILICIVLPLSLLFGLYMREVFSLSVQENAKMAQSNVQYAASNLSLFKDMVITEAARIASSDFVQQLADVKRYDRAIGDAKTLNRLNATVSRLASAQYADPRLHSVYLYQTGTDYILTSDKGVQLLNGFDDVGWLATYAEQAEAYQINRLGFWAGREVPAVDMMRYGAIGRPSRVISYIYGMTPALSKINGILVMNFDMSAIARLINEGLSDTDSMMLLIDADGTVICHVDEPLIGQDWSSEPFVQEVLGASSLSGSFALKEPSFPLLGDAGSNLYAYCDAGIDRWILVTIHSSRPFVAQTQAVSARYLAYLLGCLLLGALACYYIFNRILRPVRAIVRRFSQDTSRTPSGNEFHVVSDALLQLEAQETTLRRLLDSSHESMRQLALKRTLEGTMDVDGGDHFAWRYAGFIAVIVSMDGARALQQDMTPLERRSLRLRCIAWAQQLPGVLGTCAGVELGEYGVALVVNTDMDAGQLVAALVPFFAQARQQLGHSVSIGIGSLEDEEALLSLSLRNARMALRERLRTGHGSTNVWHESLLSPVQNQYPLELEQQLAAALDTAQREPACQALDHIREVLLLLPSDGIIYAMYRLMGMLSEYLLANQLDMQSLAPDELSISGPNDIETVDEFIALSAVCVEAVIAAALDRQEGSPHIEAIVAYIDAHYTEDIQFEAMAAEIGISYSYMRRIVHEHLRCSLLDMVHRRRMEHAVRLLLETTMPVKAIAAEVGYNTTQSFERFFRKLYYMTATEYRTHHF